MKLSFYGAAHEVTGSCFLLEAAGRNILIDCGMEQGKNLYENAEIPISMGEVDFVLLTHAHIDHSGHLPLIYARGFKGDIFTTSATAELCDIMLRDSAHIQEFEAEWRNRKAKRAGEAPYIPLYTVADAIGVIEHFRECDYDEYINICEGISVRFTDAGHLLGSASIEVNVTEDGETRRLVFSGDIGNTHQPILRDPLYPTSADYIIMESTYGDRSHGEFDDYITSLTAIIQKTFDRGGNVVIPSFAVGRTQEILYFMRKIKSDKLIHGYGDFPVYVDSPLAIEATKIFKNNMADYFDEEAQELLAQGINPLEFPGLRTSVTSDDSRMINADTKPKVIISASGMCDAGRIRHHLKHNLWRSECTVLFVGYQSVGTLGRSIVDGAQSVKLFGETIDVDAEIQILRGVSGHADDVGLIKWASMFENKPTRVFVVHGNDEVCDTFAARLESELGYTATAPYNGESWDLIADEKLCEGNKVKIVKKPSSAASRARTVYARLVEAGKRLMAVIARNEGSPNKDIARFADQVNSLCDKWDR